MSSPLSVVRVTHRELKFFNADSLHGEQTGGPTLEYYRVSAAPPGKHDVSRCKDYEKAWRAAFPKVIESLTEPGEAALACASGPMLSGCLPAVFPHAFDDEIRYHVEGVTLSEAEGYRTSWITFESKSSSLIALMAETDLDLESVRLTILLLRDHLVSEVLKTRFCDITPDWIVANGAILLPSLRHFEGCFVVGSSPIVSSRIRRISDLK